MDGSVDAFGGGGLIASIEDVARYYAALFSGQKFKSGQTLDLMATASCHPRGSPYRMGLFVRQIGDHQMFAHGSFWAADVVASQQRNIVIARPWAPRRWAST